MVQTIKCGTHTEIADGLECAEDEVIKVASTARSYKKISGTRRNQTQYYYCEEKWF